MPKRGPKPILKPDLWSKDFYLQQKELGKSDLEIADELFVSIYTLYRWKKELGFKSGDFKSASLTNLIPGGKKRKLSS